MDLRRTVFAHVHDLYCFVLCEIDGLQTKRRHIVLDSCLDSLSCMCPAKTQESCKLLPCSNVHELHQAKGCKRVLSNAIRAWAPSQMAAVAVYSVTQTLIECTHAEKSSWVPEATSAEDFP